jgi:hypothetical protein
MTITSLDQRKPAKDAIANLEKVVIMGDLSGLTANERVAYYARVCDSLGINPLTKPFAYISLNNKLTLYALRDATDQLRKVNGISVTSINRERDEELQLQIVTVEGMDRAGRTDSSIGVVSIKGLAGELLANAVMKAESKAKRRMTLSLAGLGWLDETEVDSVPQRERKSLLEAIDERTALLEQTPEVGEPEAAAVATGGAEAGTPVGSDALTAADSPASDSTGAEDPEAVAADGGPMAPEAPRQQDDPSAGSSTPDPDEDEQSMLALLDQTQQPTASGTPPDDPELPPVKRVEP